MLWILLVALGIVPGFQALVKKCFIKKFMATTLSYFCKLVEGEENKLTTFSTWTIMLGCNESNINFQQHLCKLGQLRRSNGKNCIEGQNEADSAASCGSFTSIWSSNEEETNWPHYMA